MELRVDGSLQGLKLKYKVRQGGLTRFRMRDTLIKRVVKELRCKNCNKKLGENLDGVVEIVCPRCGHFNSFK